MGQKMVTKTGAGSVSFGGVEYPVVDGVVDVPGEAAVELLSHGFEYAPIASELTDEQKTAAAAEEKARKEAEEFAALEAEEAAKAAAEEKSAKGK